MIEKLSIKEFEKIINELKNAKDDQEYFALQSKLLSYDLSDIPFVEWLDFEIYSDTNQIADFSKTKANINFSFVRFNKYFVPGNFKGCNIENLENRPWIINTVSFDNDIINNNSHLLLSNIFTEEFKEKYYSNKVTMDDLVNLSFEQIKELEEKFIMLHLIATREEKTLIKKFKLYKFVELYKYSKEDYYYVIKVLNIINNLDFFMYILDGEIIGNSKNFINKAVLKNDVKEMKKVSNDCLRDLIIKTDTIDINRDIPEEIKEENKDIFFMDVDISDKLKQKYFNKELLLTDVFYYIKFFDKFPIEKFIIENKLVNTMINKFGYGSLVKFMKKYPEFFDYLLQVSDDLINEFANCISRSNKEDDDKTFRQAVKEYYINTFGSYKGIKPIWLDTMNFRFLHSIKGINDLMTYDDNTILLNYEQRRMINLFSIDNLKRLQESTSIFSGSLNIDSNEAFENFNILAKYINYDSKKFNIFLSKKYTIFKNGKIPYEEFEKEIAEYIDLLKSNDIFVLYDFIEGEFREKHPELFIDKSAPKELIDAFYFNCINSVFLFNHAEYIPYLLDKNLSNIIKLNVRIININKNETFTTKFIDKFGNEKFLKLVVKYGRALNGIEFMYPFEATEENVIEAIEKGIYQYITKQSNSNYSDLESVKSFKEKYSDLFVDFNKLDSPLKDKMKNSFYTFSLYPKDIQECPQLVELLKDKDLKCCFKMANQYCVILDNNGHGKGVYLLDLIGIVGNEGFLKICEKYGNYIYAIYSDLFKKIEIYHSFKNSPISIFKDKNYSYEHIDKILEEILVNGCLYSDIKYKEEDAPKFLKDKHSELFLSVDAPEELKNLFYNEGLTFYNLNENKEWLPYLKDKSIKTALFKKYKSIFLKHFFEVFGEDTGIKLGIKKPETIVSMLNSIAEINMMKKWYEKTGKKFIPDVVIMENININEADKFLSNATLWNKLMKLNDFSEKQEVREAMLKLAYSFGVFDGDKRGFNKVYDLLAKIPKITNKATSEYLDRLDNDLKDIINSFAPFIKDLSKEEQVNYIINNIKKTDIRNVIFKAIKKDKIDIDFSKSIISQIFKENFNGTKTVIINQQKYPNIIRTLRAYFELNSTDKRILSSEKAHQLFGGFKLKYDPEFREFLLDNLDDILLNNDYQAYIAAIQKNFRNIKIANSNRKLTLDLAISYVQQNKYENIEIGNEGVATVSAIAGYTQEDFDTLQKIYNYGKQRVFSSIPRIENKTDKYTYEMLRLDDPLALAIGTLTDCCQEIGNVAEVCMEHSMVDKNGRIFVVRDKDGNIVSQSWVWRNGNVLCFDNIEIPNKAFDRVENRKQFTEEVYEIYNKAAEELIEKDEEVYKKLLVEEKITEEQYEGLKLKKITVGIGYNDIAEALKRNSLKDYDISRPKKFIPPVDLDRNLYVSDSTTQYILKDNEKQRSYNGQTYALHNDLYEIYDDTNFTKKELLMLGKLEMNQNNYSDILDIDKEENLVSEIADIYEFDKNRTRIIMNANFGIVYEEQENKITIGDLFYNTTVENRNIENIVVMQIRLAIEQIKGNKEIDISNLEENQKEIYNKAMALNEEIDVEKGLVK